MYLHNVSIVKKTEEFDQWLKKLRDSVAKIRVLTKITRIETGNLGDHKSVGEGVSEIKIDYGPGGYITQLKKMRLYYS
ncbi:hypothetical protein AGMMS49938_16760 [Fibrobacterales bacterium]|nr:hypothetical protein AGMMS49938_16760 [Fibrobacterales bacterium]